MGIKNHFYKIGGLIFESKSDYLFFKNIDNNINDYVTLVKNGKDIKKIFNKFNNIIVKETYFYAREELDELFINATTLLSYENTRFNDDYEVGKCFFDKIKIIEFN